MATDWNEAYVRGELPWDKGEAAPPLRTFLQRQRVTGSVLVPGCGRGHDAALLSAAGARVTGLDVAADAIRQAQQSYPDGPTFQAGDFLNLPDSLRGAFDWVVEHTCLCAIDPADRPAYARAVQQALRPQGNFLALFYRQVDDYDGSGPPHPISAPEIHGLFGQSFRVVESFVPTETFPSRPTGAEEVIWFQRTEAG